MSTDSSLPNPDLLRRQPRYQAIVLCVLAFALGVFLDRMLDWDYRFSLCAATISLLAWAVLYFALPLRISHLSKNSSVWRESSGSVFLLVGLLSVGAFWHHSRWNWFGETEISRFADEVSRPCCLEGLVTTEPRWLAPREASDGLDYQEGVVRTCVTLKVLKIRDGDDWQTASGRLDLIIHAPAQHLASGQTVRVFGRLVKTRPPTNPGQFDFRSFYRSHGKLAFLHAYQAASVQIIRPVGWRHWQFLSSLRQRLNGLTWKYVDGDEAAFASAILLGNREQLSAERRESFLETGTVHLLAISGLHVGILAGSFFLLFRVGLGKS